MLRRFTIMGKSGILMLLALAVTLVLSLPGNTHTSKNSLRALAQKRGIEFGTAVWVEPLSKDSRYRTVLAQEFNMVTPEKEMKFEPTHPEQERYNFTKKLGLKPRSSRTAFLFIATN